MVLTQTPQVFRYELLKKAFEKAREDQFTGTDESSLVERLEQIEVSVVPGSDRNIKITRPTDMELARLFLPSLKPLLEQRKLRLTLVAGVRDDVRDFPDALQQQFWAYVSMCTTPALDLTDASYLRIEVDRITRPPPALEVCGGNS